MGNYTDRQPNRCRKRRSLLGRGRVRWDSFRFAGYRCPTPDTLRDRKPALLYREE